MATCYKLFAGDFFTPDQKHYSFGISDFAFELCSRSLVKNNTISVPSLSTTKACILNSSNLTCESISKDIFLDLISPKTIDGISYARPVNQLDGTKDFMKIEVVPYIIYSDETSGNTSKQYNKFDSVQIVPAALALSERNKRENMYFILTSNKKLSVVDMLSPLVDDSVDLENGVVMYLAQYGEEFLVASPLCFIAGDNLRHSEICNLMGHSARYFCRKCLQLKAKNPNLRKKKNKNYRPTTTDFPQPTYNGSNNPIYFRLTYTNYGFKTVGGSKELLRLKSFNPALDTPVECYIPCLFVSTAI